MLINICLGAMVKTHKFKMADIYNKICILLCSGGYKSVNFVENGVILRGLNKLNPIFNLEKISYFSKKKWLICEEKNSYFLKQICSFFCTK